MQGWVFKICVMLGVVLVAAVIRTGYLSWFEDLSSAVEPDNTIIVRVAQINVKHYLRAPGRAKFVSATIHLQDKPDRVWAVVGDVDIPDSDGSRVVKSYLSAIQALCNDYTDRACWRLVKLSIGDDLLYDVDMVKPNSSSLKPPLP